MSTECPSETPGPTRMSGANAQFRRQRGIVPAIAAGTRRSVRRRREQLHGQLGRAMTNRSHPRLDGACRFPPLDVLNDRTEQGFRLEQASTRPTQACTP